jgi:hypothetical protein
MSLIHILKTARKIGIPVVITNDRGKSPQVVMPFEDFASMVNGSGACLRHSCEECVFDMDDEDEEDEDEDEDMPSIEEMNRWAMEEMEEEAYELSPKEIEELDKKSVEVEKITVEPLAQSKESEAKEAKGDVEPTSVSLEDQFYFEPIQDKEQD